jgi:hypothetical protein
MGTALAVLPEHGRGPSPLCFSALCYLCSWPDSRSSALLYCLPLFFRGAIYEWFPARAGSRLKAPNHAEFGSLVSAASLTLTNFVEP